MAKKNAPIITYTEILCRAYKQLDTERAELEAKKQRVPDDMPDLIGMLDNELHTICEKLTTIETLYKIETGTEYAG